MSELAHDQLSMYNHIYSDTDGHTTLIVEWGVDLLWQMRFHTLVLTTLKGHEPCQGWSTAHMLSGTLSSLLYYELSLVGISI